MQQSWVKQARNKQKATNQVAQNNQQTGTQQATNKKHMQSTITQ